MNQEARDGVRLLCQGAVVAAIGGICMTSDANFFESIGGAVVFVGIVMLLYGLWVFGRGFARSSTD